MKFSILLGLLLSTFSLNAQIDSLERAQINQEVWYNFIQAYQQLDASLFNQIHTDDVIRVIADQETILLGGEYKDRNLEVFNRWNSQRLKQTISFSFLSRSVKGDWAYEIGIYKLTRFNRSGTKQDYYGKFNCTLQKVNGTWKIKIDADTSENGMISEEDFGQGDILNH